VCVEPKDVVYQTYTTRRLRISKEKKKEEETTGRKYNGLPYWADIMIFIARISLHVR